LAALRDRLPVGAIKAYPTLGALHPSLWANEPFQSWLAIGGFL
jgi:hypothetical protein